MPVKELGAPPPHMMEYEGTNDKLISGKRYSIVELAKAYDMSYDLIYVRLRGKTKAKESVFARPKKDNVIWVRFIGKHKELITDQIYTLKQLGAVCGITGQAMNGRLNKRNVCTVNDLRVKPVYVTKKTPDSLNAQWMRRKLV